MWNHGYSYNYFLGTDFLLARLVLINEINLILNNKYIDILTIV